MHDVWNFLNHNISFFDLSYDVDVLASDVFLVVDVFNRDFKHNFFDLVDVVGANSVNILFHFYFFSLCFDYDLDIIDKDFFLSLYVFDGAGDRHFASFVNR